MSYLATDSTGQLTAQITRLLRDESTDNIPLLLEMIEGGGVNRCILGYLFGIAVFHPLKNIADKALNLLRKHAGVATLRQAEKLKEGAAYHYNETEYLGKYRNPEFDIFDFILANKMCLWHRAGASRSPYFEVSHRTLNLSLYPEQVFSAAISTLNFIQFITLPASKQFDLDAAIPMLMPLPLENVYLENLRLEHFPTGLFALPKLKILSIKKGTYRPRAPMVVRLEGNTMGSTSLEKLEIEGYTIENGAALGPFPALIEADLTRCGLEHIDFLEKSTRLSRLNLKSNDLKELPAFIGQLTQLRWLDLSNNPFKVLHLDLSELYQLEHFELKLGK